MLTLTRLAARSVVLLPLAALLLAGCEQNFGPASGLTTMTLTPNPSTMAINTAQQFTAVGYDGSGAVVAIPAGLTWSVGVGGGTINSSGVFTAGAVTGPFTNTIRATSGSIEAFATVNVTAPVLATLTITPNPATMGFGNARLFTAVGRDSSGAIVAIPTGLIWSVVNSGGTINSATGKFTAGNTGGPFTNTVRARSGSISGFASVIVTTNPAPTVPLGNAEPYGILAGTAVTCVTNGIIDADVGVSPGNALTGFPPCTLTGETNLANAVSASAQIDLTAAYNQLAGMACGTNIVADLGGTTLAPGVYCSASSIGVTGPVTLDGQGDPNAVFVFQAGSGLTTAGSVVLIGGAQARNVYWQVGTSATLGTSSAWQGNILALTTITLVDDATLLGRALARNGAVSLGANNTITLPQ